MPFGSLSSETIHTPSKYINRIIKGHYYEKPFGSLTLKKNTELQIPGTLSQIQKKIAIAKRAGKEIKNEMYVNLGIGIPTLIPNFLPKDINIILHGENGLLGIGPYPNPGNEDPDLTNAGKETITMVNGASTFSSSTSFGIIRGNHLDLTILGGLQVSENGDLANWIVPGKMVKGMGGAMDLASSNTKCVVCMEHMAKGKLRVVDQCSVPLTGKRVVSLLITEFGVFEFNKNTGMTLVEIAENVSLDTIKENTSAKYFISSGLKTMTD